MNLGEKIQYIIDNFQDYDSIVIFYTESTDNHLKKRMFTSHFVECMHSYLKDYQEYGVVEGCDPKGVWFKFIDFELARRIPR